jgi:hypothetical protein
MKPLLKGVFGSFSDAPDGFKEEIQEVAIALVLEYWYNNIFALRAGIQVKTKTKATAVLYCRCRSTFHGQICC